MKVIIISRARLDLVSIAFPQCNLKELDNLDAILSVLVSVESNGLCEDIL